MQPLQTTRPHAGVHEVSNIGPGDGRQAGDGFKDSIRLFPPFCQSPAAHECYAQVAYHLAMAERWLDLASEARP